MARRRSSPAPKRKRRWPKLAIALAAIVVGLVVLSSATAVTAMQFENHDDFCASCHSQPESAYFQREVADAVDLASFHAEKNVHCIDCHSGPGLVPGRVTALTLGAKDLLAWVTGHAAQPAVATRPIDDANCLKCHEQVTEQRNFNNHFHVFLSRWQALDTSAATCVSCHQSHNTQGETQLAFLNRNDTVQVCQSCHRALGAGG